MEKEKVKDFIDSLDLPKYIADVLFKTWNDCVLFLNRFYNRNAFVTDDVLDFREYKISQSTATSDSFMRDCREEGLKSTFEKTFYQSFKDEDIKLLQNSINLGIISLDSLFNSFKQNPNKNILKYVL